MADPWIDAELIRRFRESAATSERRAPLNAALARIIADDRSLSGLLAHAPPEQQLPVLLLAAIHHELLAEPDHALSRWYPNLTAEPAAPDDPRLAAVLTGFVHERVAAILDSITTRNVQTNEIGRTAMLVAGIGDTERRLRGRPLVHLDVGTSAGLNLLFDRLRYRFRGDDGTERTIEPSTSPAEPLTIDCEVRGRLELPDRLPPVSARCGLDLRPVDLDDEDSRRWLEACVWPDQTDRFERLVAAIELARRDPAPIVTGDAVRGVSALVERHRGSGVPLITTTWVLNYLDDTERRRFARTIHELGADDDLVWVFAEAPALTPGLPHAQGSSGEHRTAITRVSWIDGERSVDHVAIGHPHGYWLHAST